MRRTAEQLTVRASSGMHVGAPATVIGALHHLQRALEHPQLRTPLDQHGGPGHHNATVPARAADRAIARSWYWGRSSEPLIRSVMLEEFMAEAESDASGESGCSRSSRPPSLADHVFTVFEGGFILTRAMDEPDQLPAQLAHVRHYLELLFGLPIGRSERGRRRAAIA